MHQKSYMVDKLPSRKKSILRKTNNIYRFKKKKNTRNITLQSCKENEYNEDSIGIYCSSLY